jgi:hypothetical protein
MRYSKNPELPSRRGAVLPVRICLAVCVLLVSVTAWARDIRIEYAVSELVEGVYYADARIHFDLDEDILLALEHGVAIDIHTLLRVRRERKWLWDPLAGEDRIHYRLQHHPLSDDYVVSDEDTGERHQFASAEAAVEYLSGISNRRLLDASKLEAGSTYTGYIKVRLSMESLPAPLQPAAYVSGRWQMESAWYEWIVR